MKFREKIGPLLHLNATRPLRLYAVIHEFLGFLPPEPPFDIYIPYVFLLGHVLSSASLCLSSKCNNAVLYDYCLTRLTCRTIRIYRFYPFCTCIIFKKYDFAVKSVFEFWLFFSEQFTLYAFQLHADDAFSADRSHYRLTAHRLA